jgi:glycogen(starch) synthase
MGTSDASEARMRRRRREPARARSPSSSRSRALPRKSRMKTGTLPTTGGEPTLGVARRRSRAGRRAKRTEVAHDRSKLDELSRDLSWARAPVPLRAGVIPLATRRLHVVMVGWEFPPSHSGGLGVHVFELCRELTRMGHRVTFLTPFSGPFTEVPGVTMRWPGGPKPEGRRRGAPEPAWPHAYDRPIDLGRPALEAMTDYNGWISQLTGLGPVDVVHVHDWFGTQGARTLARRLHRPLIMTVHSTEYDRSLGNPWSAILEREQLGLDAADRVIAVSRHLKAQLVERYHVTPEKVHVIYNAVRPPERLARIESTREPIVLYLGRLAAMKGVDTFLRAGARVLFQLPEVLLVVAGEGPEYPRLLTLAAHLGISERVLFLGKVTEEERTALLARASVFVLPSVIEPFGIAALEAMAAGVPTIISKTSGVAEVSQEVFVVDFWDIDEFASRIAELVEYPTLRNLMGERGRMEALKEGWAERALETAGVYAELSSGLGRSRR